jgi:hypothetical protein
MDTLNNSNITNDISNNISNNTSVFINNVNNINVTNLINNDYFNTELKLDDKKDDFKQVYDNILLENSKLLNEIMDLKFKNKELILKNDLLEKKTLELLKTLNEILKLGKTDSELKEFNTDNIKTKIMSILYRELRLKHIMPFSPFIANFSSFQKPSIMKNI